MAVPGWSPAALIPGVAAIGGGATGGVTAETGGWVNGAGRLGAEDGPEGGARLIAPPGDGSGMEDGGTGGGRSLKNWARDGFGNARVTRPASASANAGRALRAPRSVP